MRSFRAERVLDRPPEVVWAALADLPSWGAWNMVTATAPEGLAPGRTLRLRIQLPGGLRLPASATIVAFEPGREIRWRGGLPGVFVGVHGFWLAPEGAGTRLVHDETLTGLLVGPICRLVGLDEARYAAVNDALARHLSA